MAYRGPAIQQRIRKTTIGNKTGDNFSITIPRILAKKFEGIFFKLTVSGNNITFESGCKINLADLKNIQNLGNYKDLEKTFIEGKLK
jgi:hypothetical protein